MSHRLSAWATQLYQTAGWYYCGAKLCAL